MIIIKKETVDLLILIVFNMIASTAATWKISKPSGIGS